MCNECDILITYPKLALHSLSQVGPLSAGNILHVGDGPVVLPRIGRTWLSGQRDQAREVIPNQKTQDAIHMASVSTNGPLHNYPVPAQVIDKKF
jgi:hypothetical protein